MITIPGCGLTQPIKGPRSASYTTVDETTLLEIRQDEFYDVMESRDEFMRGVMQALSGRIRTLIDLHTQDA